MSPNANPWLSFRREVANPKLRLFCFPFGGGGASTYALWPQGMPPGVEVCPVQPPGREERSSEPAITRMGPMVARLTEALSPFLQQPFALFGHSVSALTVFELTRELRRLGQRSPEWLFVSGHPAPELPRRRPRISHLAQPAFTAALREVFDVDPALVDNPELMDNFFPTLRADYELVESYIHRDEPPLEVPVSVFGGTRDPETTEAELQAWQKHTCGAFRTKILAGNHMFINSSRTALVGEVAEDLAQLSSLTGSPGR